MWAAATKGNPVTGQALTVKSCIYRLSFASWVICVGAMANAQDLSEAHVMEPHSGAFEERNLEVPGPLGPLSGTLTRPTGDENATTVILIPGSGPTDRDGNSRLGITGGPYRALAHALADGGVATLRIDKRGMFGSRDAVADPNDVTLAAYGEDIAAWAMRLRQDDLNARCIVLLGHSEGGLVAMEAAATVGADAVILLAAPGRPLAQILRDQLAANPANAPLMEDAELAIKTLETGARFDVAGLPAPLQPLFAPAVQGFLIDLFSRDPAAVAASLTMPVLVVQGARDLQVTEADARRLHAAAAGSELVLIEGMNHVLKPVEASRDDNLQSYADPDRGLVPELPETLLRFLTELQNC